MADPTYTNTIQPGENLSTIAQSHGMSAADFAALNPHLAATGPGSYLGLKNIVQPGTGYNVAAPKAPVVASPTVTTPPAGSTTGTPTGAPTIGSVYNIPTVQEDPELTAARTAYDTFVKNQAGGTPNVDENAIRSNTLAQYQAEIDAVNALYADKLNQAKIVGAGRIGSSTAIQARRGLLGSDFGGAETDTVNNGNTQIYNGIDAEKGAAINALLTKARDAGTQAIADKTKAIGEGLDAHLKYLNDSATRKTTNATTAAQFIYNQKLSPKDLTPDQLQKTADGYGVTTQDIINAYTGVKKTGDEAAATKAAEDLKNKKAGITVIPQGSKVVDANGKEIAQGNPKTFAPKSSVPKAVSTYKNFSAKPSSANVSKVNAYITAHGGNAAAIGAANGDETSFYKVLNAANAEAKKTTTPASTVPVAP